MISANKLQSQSQEFHVYKHVLNFLKSRPLQISLNKSQTVGRKAAVEVVVIEITYIYIERNTARWLTRQLPLSYVVTPSMLNTDTCLSLMSSNRRSSQALRVVSEALKRWQSLYQRKCRAGDPRAVHTKIIILPSRAGTLLWLSTLSKHVSDKTQVDNHHCMLQGKRVQNTIWISGINLSGWVSPMWAEWVNLVGIFLHAPKV